MTPAALALVLSAVGAPGDDWVCVASEDGVGWECGRGEAAPAVRPVPPPVRREQPVPAPVDRAPGGPARRAAAPAGGLWLPGTATLAEPEPRRPMILAPVAGPARSAGAPAARMPRARAAPAPDAAPAPPPAGAGAYSLRLAGVPTRAAALRLAEDFEVNPADALVGRLEDAGGTRYLLLVGRFDTPAEAVAAIDRLPAVARALGPRVERVAELAAPPEPLAAGADPRVPDPGAVARGAGTTTGRRTLGQPSPANRTGPAMRERDPASPAPVAAGAPEEAPTDRNAAPPGAPAPIRAAAKPPTDGADAFAAASGAYTIQLANVPDRSAVRSFLAAHRLPPSRLYALPAPRGRWLVVLGRYDTLAAAQAALETLPPTLRAPWIRRAAPLSGSESQPAPSSALHPGVADR